MELEEKRLQRRNNHKNWRLQHTTHNTKKTHEKTIIRKIEEEKKITVTEIYVRLRLEQSVASQHLAILRKAGIVNTERDGKFIYYTVNYKRIDEISQFVKDLVG